MDDAGRALVDLADHLDLPDDPALVDRVVAAISVDRIAAPVVRGRRRRAFAAALALAFAGVGVSAGPAIADWLRVRIGGVEVERVPERSPERLGTGLDIGRPVTLDEAQASVASRFDVRTLPGEPDVPDVWLDTIEGIPVVSLVYSSSADLPPTRAGVGALVQQFAAPLEEPALMRKTIGPDVTIEQAVVGGRPALWFSGEHAIALRHAGVPRFAPSRLAANAVVWEDGGVTYRVETALSRDAAIALAESLR